MRNNLFATLVIAALTGSAVAQTVPTSISAASKITETISCDISNNCSNFTNGAFSVKQTFELTSSQISQMGPDTEIVIDVIELGTLSFKLGDDSKYEAGDESVSVKKTLLPNGVTFTAKMSWKGGICKVSVKGKFSIDDSIISATMRSSANAGLEPGNPGNTVKLTVNFENGGISFVECEGYVAIDLSMNVKSKALPDNAVSTQVKFSIKSKYQVGEPAGIPF